MGEAGLSVPCAGQPHWCSEFGGIWWDPDAPASDGADFETSWGYGRRPRTEDEFHERFRGLVDVLLDNPHMFGCYYTQLTDVFQLATTECCSSDTGGV